MLAFAFPDRVARNRGNGDFVLANGRGAAVDRASALARTPYIAVAELTGTAANGRILLAAPITQAEMEIHRFADHIETADEIIFDRNALALRARREKKTLHAITLSEAPLALQSSVERRARDGRRADFGRPRQIAMVETRKTMARPRDVPAQGGGRRCRTFLARSLRRCAGGTTQDLAGAGAVRQDLAEGIFGRRSVGSADDAVALGLARAARAGSA